MNYLFGAMHYHFGAIGNLLSYEIRWMLVNCLCQILGIVVNTLPPTKVYAFAIGTRITKILLSLFLQCPHREMSNVAMAYQFSLSRAVSIAFSRLGWECHQIIIPSLA